MKKKLLVFFAICLFTIQSKGQFPYSSIWAAYPLSYSLSAGFATTNTPGFFWLGYMATIQNISTTWHSNKNFCIMGSGASSFWSAYKVYAGALGCDDTISQVLNGLGVAAIETNGPNNLNYALAGVFDRGCYFATLDNSGNVLSTQLFSFPKSSGLGFDPPSKPIIVELANKNQYYICGSFEGSMYVIKVDATGNVLWSSFYKLTTQLSPKDMIISTKNPNNLLIIGNVQKQFWSTDGFFMELNGSNGNVNFVKSYGTPIIRDGFNSITAASYISSANADGYVIGGYAELIPGQAWIIKLDPSGNIIWSKLIKPSSGINSGVADIIERRNTSNNFEYYGVLASNAGMVVIKLDDSGNPFPISSPNALYNEFVYNISAYGSATPNSISCINNTGTPSLNSSINPGIQVFGTTNNFPGFTSSYVVSAYFNGQTNCSGNLTTINSVSPGPYFIEVPMAIKYGSLPTCSNFQILAFFPGGSVNYPCSGLMSNGSNQRGMVTGIPAVAITNSDIDFNVYPNPVSNKATVNYTSGDNDKIKIEVYNLLGQSIKTLQPEGRTAGSNTEEIDFNDLKIESGVYFVALTINNNLYKQKILYTK